MATSSRKALSVRCADSSPRMTHDGRVAVRFPNLGASLWRSAALCSLQSAICIANDRGLGWARTRSRCRPRRPWGPCHCAWRQVCECVRKGGRQLPCRDVTHVHPCPAAHQASWHKAEDRSMDVAMVVHSGMLDRRTPAGSRAGQPGPALGPWPACKQAMCWHGSVGVSAYTARGPTLLGAVGRMAVAGGGHPQRAALWSRRDATVDNSTARGPRPAAAHW